MRPDAVILLVEDELPVRKFVSEVLHNAGYTVVAASSGRDALRAFQEYAKRIDLLITDVDLTGGMSGVEVAEQLEARNPDIRVLLMSGSPNQFAFDNDLHFICKPFVPAHLLRKVEEVISHKAGLQFRRDRDRIQQLLSKIGRASCRER